MKSLTRERISVEPFTTRTRRGARRNWNRWAVSWRKKKGKRTRKFFGTRKQASLFADSMRPPPAKEAPEVTRRRKALQELVGRA
jgi:hypothetical protein